MVNFKFYTKIQINKQGLGFEIKKVRWVALNKQGLILMVFGAFVDN